MSDPCTCERCRVYEGLDFTHSEIEAMERRSRAHPEHHSLIRMVGCLPPAGPIPGLRYEVADDAIYFEVPPRSLIKIDWSRRSILILATLGPDSGLPGDSSKDAPGRPSTDPEA